MSEACLLEQLFHGAPTSVGGFLRGGSVGYVALERDVSLLGFFGESEVGVAGDASVDLDEVGSAGFDFVDGVAASSGFLTTREPRHTGGSPSTMALTTTISGEGCWRESSARWADCPCHRT